MRPGKLSYLVEIDERVYVRGRSARSNRFPSSRRKVFFFSREGVLDLDLEKGEEEVGVSVNLDNSSPQVQPTLRRELLIKEETCKATSSYALASGSTCADFLLTALSDIGKSFLQRENQQRKLGGLEANGQAA